MDGMFGLPLDRFELLIRSPEPDRKLAARALSLTVALAVLTIGALLTLDAFGVAVPIVDEFPALAMGAV